MPKVSISCIACSLQSVSSLLTFSLIGLMKSTSYTLFFFHHEDENMNSKYLKHSCSYDHKEEEVKFDQMI